jgi:hypothetical protein
MVSEMAISEKVTALANENLSEERVTEIFSSIQDAGLQMGADFTNELLAGIANNKDFDFSSLFGELTQEEVDTLTGLDSESLMKRFGLDSKDLTDLGFANGEEFKKAFDEGFSAYDDEAAKKAMVAELGMTEEAFEAYVDEIQKNNKHLQDNEELAQ